ncbi:MAG: hypothetical protein DBX47_00760 [Clostridiales bacterium]|nr:MAG: hypothetical protein DBX47_00760 [Clostridiales bacterium]
MLLQEIRAKEIIDFIQTLPQVKSCLLYGSLADGRADKLSDIDIKIDVSGFDNGMFMKNLPNIIAAEFNVLWYDYAQSLAPEQYIVSVAIDDNCPFCIVDFNCTSVPHLTTVQKNGLENNMFIHILKLWIANCKHYIRGANYSSDIRKMGRKCIGTVSEEMTDFQIIEEVLNRLESNAPIELENYILNCRKAWENR